MSLLSKNGEQCRTTAWLVLCCSLFCVQDHALFAQNLVPNPSFELIDSCPQYPYLLGYQPGAVPEYWYSSSDTPDYFNACVDTAADVPDNHFGQQYAVEGSAYSGMFSYLTDDHREMIAVELTNDLVIGQTYYASFFASAAEGAHVAIGRTCNNLGLLFCTEPYYWIHFSSMPEFGIHNYAHVWSQDVISDTVNWVLVSGSFVADSAYRYMVVGNHFSNANTEVDSIGPALKAYHFVDQFCVSPEPLGCPLVNSVGDQSTIEVGVFPNPVRDLLRITWSGQLVGRLSVTDMLGRLLWQKHVEGGSGVGVDVSDWSRGQYVLSILGGDIRRSFKVVLVE